MRAARTLLLDVMPMSKHGSLESRMADIEAFIRTHGGEVDPASIPHVAQTGGYPT